MNTPTPSHPVQHHLVGNLAAPLFVASYPMKYAIRLIFCLFAGLALTQPARAQSAADAPAKSTSYSDGNRIVMDPFSVMSSKDYGYRDANSISATGIGTPIIDIPISIAVLPSDLITDFAATQLSDVMSKVTGVQASNRQGFNTAFQVRGFVTTPQVDGYDVSAYTSGTAIGVDRVEISKGPSAVFNGEGPPGGVINIITKRPSFTQRSYIEGAYGSWDFSSGEIFSTGPLLGDKVAYLLDAYYKTDGGWVNYTHSKEKLINLGMTWVPISAVNLTVKFSLDDQRVPVQGIPGTHSGFLDSGVPVTTNIGTWVAQNFGSDAVVIDQHVPASYFPGGYRYNIFGPQGNVLVHNSTVNPELTVKINDHIDLRSGIFFENQVLNSTVNSDESAYLIPAGLPGLIYSNGARVILPTRSHEFKEELAFHFDTGPLKHSLLIGYQYKTGVSHITFGASPDQYWNYLTQGPPLVLDQFEAAGSYFLQNYRISNGNFRAYYIAEQASALNGRVHVLLGDSYTKDIDGSGNITTDATPLAGILIRPFPNTSFLKDTCFFVNVAKSFIPSGLAETFGGKAIVVPPERGTGKEVGFKTDWFNGAVSSTLSIFRDDLTNIAEFNFVSSTTTEPRYDLGVAQRTEGAELDVIWTPRANFQVDANYTWLPTAETTSNPNSPAAVGTRMATTPIHRFNLNGKYTFTSGALRGIYIGGGVLAQSSSRGAPGQSYQNQVPESAGLIADAFIGYNTKILGRTTDLRLNVKNFTDERAFILNPDNPTIPISVYFTLRFSM
jgi:iron complex outermembrane receptor protein